MTAETLSQVKFRFETRNVPKESLTSLTSRPCSFGGHRRRAAGFETAQRAFLSTCRRPMVKAYELGGTLPLPA
jgi:hypothetical protein